MRIAKEKEHDRASTQSPSPVQEFDTETTSGCLSLVHGAVAAIGLQFIVVVGSVLGTVRASEIADGFGVAVAVLGVVANVALTGYLTMQIDRSKDRVRTDAFLTVSIFCFLLQGTCQVWVLAQL